MIKNRKFPKVFFGWWTVLASGIIDMWGQGYHSYGFSALFKPISSELGFSRTAASVPASIARLEGGIEAPLSGWLTDKYGPRWVAFFGVFVSGLSLILMNYINSLWSLYVVWGVMLGTAFNIGGSIPLETAISNWFVKKRGLAMSIKWPIAGLSGVLTLPLIAWLISVQGWRMTCVIGGVVLWAVGLPLIWFCFKRHRPEYYGLLPDGATVEEETADADQLIERGVEYAAAVQEVEFTLRQAMKSPTFWLLIAVGTIPGLAQPVMNIHGIPFLTDRGIDSLKAAEMMATMVAVSLPARFVGGFLADRFKTHHLRFLIGGTYLLQGAGFVIFLLNQSITSIYIWFSLYGFGMGAAMPLRPLINARYFGRKAFGSIQGTRMMIMTPIGVAAPIFCGWIYDTTGSYMIAFVMLAISLTVAGVMMSLILPPKPPAEVTDIRKIT